MPPRPGPMIEGLYGSTTAARNAPRPTPPPRQVPALPSHQAQPSAPPPVSPAAASWQIQNPNQAAEQQAAQQWGIMPNKTGETLARTPMPQPQPPPSMAPTSANVPRVVSTIPQAGGYIAPPTDMPTPTVSAMSMAGPVDPRLRDRRAMLPPDLGSMQIINPYAGAEQAAMDMWGGLSSSQMTGEPNFTPFGDSISLTGGGGAVDAGFPAGTGTGTGTGDGTVPAAPNPVTEAVEAIASDTPGVPPSAVPNETPMPVEESTNLAGLLDKLMDMSPGEIFEIPRYLQEALYREDPAFVGYFDAILRALGFKPMGDMGMYGFETDYYVPQSYQWNESAFNLMLQMGGPQRKLMERLLKALLGHALVTQQFSPAAVEELLPNAAPAEQPMTEQPLEPPTLTE